MESFIIANGIPVHVSFSGTGKKTLIFLHGFLETMYVWESFIEKVGSNFTIISIDLPGHGLTGTDETSNTLSFMSIVVSEVLIYFKVDKAIVIGHSMGGYLAIEFAKLFPDKVEALVLFNSTPFADSVDKKEDRVREIGLIKAGKLLTIASVSLPKMFAPQNLVKFHSTIEELVEISDIHENLGIIASINGLMQREDNFEFLKKLLKPVYFIFGLYDRFIPVERAKVILEEMCSKKGIILENSGHISFVEEEDKCVQIINDFIEELS